MPYRVLVALALLFAALMTPARATEADDYLEAMRPRVEARKLTKEEKAALATLLVQVKAKPTEANLDALRPFALTGDKKAMRVMIEGYEAIRTAPESFPGRENGYRQPPVAERARVLTALWGVAYWEQHGPDRVAAASIATCFPPGMTRESFDVVEHRALEYRGGVHARSHGVDCGFDVYLENLSFGDENFDAYARGKGPTPIVSRFEHRRLSLTPEEAARKFESVLDDYASGRTVESARYWWAKDHAYEQGGEAVLRYEAALRGHSDAVRAAEERRAAAREEYRRSRIPEWEARMESGVNGLDDAMDLEALSSAIGAEALVAYGKRYTMYMETNINAVCRLDAEVCRRQVSLFEARVADARAEQLARDALFRIDTSGSAFTTVRVYDSNGNFVGTTSMTHSQAETAGQ